MVSRDFAEESERWTLALSAGIFFGDAARQAERISDSRDDWLALSDETEVSRLAFNPALV